MVGEREVLCRSCDSAQVRQVHIREKLAYFVCSTCGHCEKLQLDDPNLDSFEEAQTKYYGDETAIFNAALSPFEKEVLTLRCHVAGEHFAPGSHVLEVGPGAGQFLAWLKSIGFQVTAAEHSPQLASRLTADLATDVIVGEFETMELPTGTFDAFCSFHVIEHVRSPELHLQKAHNVVQPGGVALVATPNARSWEQRIPGLLSPNFDSAHLRIFSPRSLQRLARACGWQVRQCLTPEYSTGWLRIASKIVRRVRGQDEEKTAGQYAARSSAAMAPIASAIQIGSMPLRYVQQRMGGGNEIFLVLRKPDE